jgi:hypothetical protein
MPTTISRTWFNTLVDDDGSGEVGSIIAKADFGTILTDIDQLFAGTLSVGGAVQSGTGTFTGPTQISFQTGGGEHWRIDSTGALIGYGPSVRQIRLSTGPPGNDDQQLDIWAGGAASQARSAGITLFGNQNGAAPGRINLLIGNASAAELVIWNSATVRALTVDGGTGAMTFNASVSQGWIFNSSHSNGGYFGLQRGGGINSLLFGAGPALGFGAIADAVMYAPNGRLYLEGAAGAGVYSVRIANDALAVAANLAINTGTGRIAVATSSLRYKHGVLPLEDWRWLLDLRPISYVANGDDSGRRYGGLSAEDVAAHSPRGEHGLPLYAGLDRDGRPNDVSHGAMVAPLILAVQELTRRVASLEGRQ